MLDHNVGVGMATQFQCLQTLASDRGHEYLPKKLNSSHPSRLVSQ